jgi:hypothetical protein
MAIPTTLVRGNLQSRRVAPSSLNMVLGYEPNPSVLQESPMRILFPRDTYSKPQQHFDCPAFRQHLADVLLAIGTTLIGLAGGVGTTVLTASGSVKLGWVGTRGKACGTLVFRHGS